MFGCFGRSPAACTAVRARISDRCLGSVDTKILHRAVLLITAVDVVFERKFNRLGPFNGSPYRLTSVVPMCCLGPISPCVYLDFEADGTQRHAPRQRGRHFQDRGRVPDGRPVLESTRAKDRHDTTLLARLLCSQVCVPRHSSCARVPHIYNSPTYQSDLLFTRYPPRDEIPFGTAGGLVGPLPPVEVRCLQRRILML